MTYKEQLLEQLKLIEMTDSQILSEATTVLAELVAFAEQEFKEACVMCAGEPETIPGLGEVLVHSDDYPDVGPSCMVPKMQQFLDVDVKAEREHSTTDKIKDAWRLLDDGLVFLVEFYSDHCVACGIAWVGNTRPTASHKQNCFVDKLDTYVDKLDRYIQGQERDARQMTTQTKYLIKQYRETYDCTYGEAERFINNLTSKDVQDLFEEFHV